MDEAKILAFAKKEGYDDIRYIGKWRGYDSYEPLVEGASEQNPAIIGLPFTILVKGDAISMSTEEEAMAQIAEEEKVNEKTPRVRPCMGALSVFCVTG